MNPQILLDVIPPVSLLQSDTKKYSTKWRFVVIFSPFTHDNKLGKNHVFTRDVQGYGKKFQSEDFIIGNPVIQILSGIDNMDIIPTPVKEIPEWRISRSESGEFLN